MSLNATKEKRKQQNIPILHYQNLEKQQLILTLNT